MPELGQDADAAALEGTLATATTITGGESVFYEESGEVGDLSPRTTSTGTDGDADIGDEDLDHSEDEDAFGEEEEVWLRDEVLANGDSDNDNDNDNDDINDDDYSGSFRGDASTDIDAAVSAGTPADERVDAIVQRIDMIEAIATRITEKQHKLMEWKKKNHHQQLEEEGNGDGEEEEAPQAALDAEQLAEEWNHLIKEKASSYQGSKGDDDDLGVNEAWQDDDDDDGDVEMHPDSIDEDNKDPLVAVVRAVPPPTSNDILTPAKELRQRLSVGASSSPRSNSSSSSGSGSGTRGPVDAAFLISKFGAPGVSQALQLLEASLEGSPAKISTIVSDARDKSGIVPDTQEEMLRLQEDRLLEGIESLLGSEGLEYLDDLCALLEQSEG